MKVLLIAPATPGHSLCINILKKVLQTHLAWDITENYLDYGKNSTTSPKEFVFENCSANIERLQKLYNISSFDLIVNDFFAIEGYILGKIHNIPTIVSIPAILGENFYSASGFNNDMNNMKEVRMIEQSYGITFPEPKCVSDGWLFEGDSHIVWNYPKAIPSTITLDKSIYNLIGSKKASKKASKKSSKKRRGSQENHCTLL